MTIERSEEVYEVNCFKSHEHIRVQTSGNRTTTIASLDIFIRSLQEPCISKWISVDVAVEEVSERKGRTFGNFPPGPSN